MPSGSPSLDVGIEHEGLWLLGLIGIVVGAGAFGVFLDATRGPSIGIEVSERSDTDRDFGAANVTVARATDGNGFETVHRGTVSGSSRVVYRSDRPGTYRVRVELPDFTCDRRVSVRRTDDGFVTRKTPPDHERWACAPYVTIDVEAATGWP